MEKTMRWWSDCTANWREKWSKVRNERNKAREEAKILRNKLEIAIKDTNHFKHENQELEIQNQQLAKEIMKIQKVQVILLKHAGQLDKQKFTIPELEHEGRNAIGIDDLLVAYNLVKHSEKPSSAMQNSKNDSTSRDEGSGNTERRSTPPNRDIEEYVLQGAVPKHAVELYKESLDRDLAKLDSLIPESNEISMTTNVPELFVESPVASLDRDIGKLIAECTEMQEKSDKRQASVEMASDDYLVQKMSMLNLRLEEATRVISAERE